MSTNSLSFEERLAADAALTATVLDHCLSAEAQPQEIVRPARLLAAMRHGVLNGGKRLRPHLVLESARLLGGDPQAALRVAAALECVHCYSLIHDDLPAMDDDDLRRGQPTVHIAFDDATAILAGDSLMTLAFDILASDETPLAPRQKADLVVALARAAGLAGMAGGQALDLEAERNAPDEAGIVMLQAMKTGALIRFACESGALIAGSPDDDRRLLRRFGETVGLAFQLADDLLDMTSNAATLGKATGKDAGRGKGTLVALHGEEWTRQKLDQLVSQAQTLLEPFGSKAEALMETARFIASRQS
jgi:farnesyl diphosphate synthase